jgi:hypothetical protein
MYNFERERFGRAQPQERVLDVFSHRIRMPQAAGLKTHEENRNGGVDALDGVRHSLPAFVHSGIDVTVAQQRAVEGGRERACVRHENEVLHGDDCGDTEPDDLRGDGSERRRVFGHRSSSPAGTATGSRCARYSGCSIRRVSRSYV